MVSYDSQKLYLKDCHQSQKGFLAHLKNHSILLLWWYKTQALRCTRWGHGNLEMPHFPKVVMLPTFNPLAICCTRFEFIIACFKICLLFYPIGFLELFPKFPLGHLFAHNEFELPFCTMGWNFENAAKLFQNITCLATFLFFVSDETFYQIMHSMWALLGIIVGMICIAA